MLMCPVCPAETIDQAQVEISFQMRAVVREMLAEGRTREEILDYFVDRYGADILAAPPKVGGKPAGVDSADRWSLRRAGLGALFLVISVDDWPQGSSPLPPGRPLGCQRDSRTLPMNLRANRRILSLSK